MRMGEGPRSHRAADGHPAVEILRTSHLGFGDLDRVAQTVVGVDDERGQQLVAAREVAVDGGRHHAHLTGDGPERQCRGSVLGELTAGGVEDLLGEFGAHARPCRGSSHACIIDHFESNGKNREHCS